MDFSIFKIRSRKPKPGKTLNTKICEAIRTGFLVRCEYVNDGERLIHSYCHGHTKEGVEILSAYQVAGPGSSDEDTGWKCFDVTKIRSFEILSEKFTVREDYNREHPGVTQIHCQIGSD